MLQRYSSARDTLICGVTYWNLEYGAYALSRPDSQLFRITTWAIQLTFKRLEDEFME